jgi:hypothetical protein
MSKSGAQRIPDKEMHAMSERPPYQGQELYSEEECVEQARRSMASFGESVQELAEANKSLLEARDQWHSFNARGFLTITPGFRVIECTVNVFDDGTRLHFKGFAPSGGYSFEGRFTGAGSFSVPPGELVGDGDFSVRMSDHGTPPAQMRIDWYAGRPPGYKLVGTYLGDSPTHWVLPPFNGGGTWTNITNGG